jgi:hypothetical protein
MRGSRKPVTRRSFHWKLVDSIFEPLHIRFNFTLERCVDDKGLNSHGDLPDCSPSDSILERDLSGEHVLINPPWKLAEQIGRYFESFRRTAPSSTMAVFVLPKWAKFNEFTRHWNFTKNSQQGHNCLLANRWTIRLNRRRLLHLLGMFNCGLGFRVYG